MSSLMAVASITTLPAELLLSIVIYLLEAAPNDLLHLRATCHTLCEALQDMIAERYFSDRAFFIGHENSLQTLLGISKHPAFSKRIKCIRFSFARLRYHHVCPIPVPIELQSVGRSRPMGTIRVPQTVRDELHELPDAFHESGRDCELLEKVFANFRRAGNTPSIVAMGNISPHPGRRFSTRWWKKERKLLEERAARMNSYWYKAYGHLQLGEESEYALTLHKEDAFLFETVLTAICDAGYPVSSLELGSDIFGCPPSNFAHLRDCAAWASLRTLYVALGVHESQKFWVGRDPSEDGEVRRAQYETDIQHFATFLRSAQNLETLTARQSFHARGLRGLIFPTILSATTRPDQRGSQPPAFAKLKELELAGLQIQLEALLIFMRVVPVLKRLKLLDVTDAAEPKTLTFKCSWGIKPPAAKKLILEAAEKEYLELEAVCCHFERL